MDIASDSASDAPNYRCGLYFDPPEMADTSGSLKDIDR
jgi:hypothetical protein